MYGYDNAAIAAQCRVMDRQREVAREHVIAAARRPSRRPLIAAIGRGSVRAGIWLQLMAQPAEHAMRRYAKEHVQ
jgi:hypothetical protein